MGPARNGMVYVLQQKLSEHALLGLQSTTTTSKAVQLGG